MSQEAQPAIMIRWQDDDDETMEVWVNGRCIATLNHDEHGSEALWEVQRVLELAATELGVLFFR